MTEYSLKLLLKKKSIKQNKSKKIKYFQFSIYSNNKT